MFKWKEREGTQHKPPAIHRHPRVSQATKPIHCHPPPSVALLKKEKDWGGGGAWDDAYL